MTTTPPSLDRLAPTHGHALVRREEPASDARAVRAAQVFPDEAAAVQLEGGVRARHRRVIDHDVGLDAAAQHRASALGQRHGQGARVPDGAEHGPASAGVDRRQRRLLVAA
ncbi:MAG: hypothetical protein IPM79_29275 [Polyangiaceae bacterium]|nr:hypothetical protein [Polyangiaceae bacterium]